LELDVASADHPVLIVGGDGLIGRALHETYRAAGVPCLATSRRAEQHPQLDLASSPETWELAERYSVAFLCAGRTKLADCETHAAETALINVTRTTELARKLWERGAFVIFLSTNLVFAGNKAFPAVDDGPNPTTAYGRQKGEAEKILRELGERVAIVRLTKVVHPAMPLLLDWAAALRRREVIHPYSDMVFSPIPLEYVAGALRSIASRQTREIIHLSAETDVSYASLAASLAERLDVSTDLVQPQAAPAPASRFGTLRMRAEDAALLKPPPAAETIRELLASLT
jgi:dTDP-4-dehydrorhamnose reductase